MKILLTLLLTINLCFAQQIKPINKGDSAPFDGYVIDKPFEEKARKTNEQLKLEKRKNDLLSELGKVNDTKVDFYKDEAKTAKREFIKSQVKTVLYFVLGIVAGAGAVYVGSKVAK